MVSENEILSFIKNFKEEIDSKIAITEDKAKKQCKLLRRGEKVFLVIWEETNPLRIELRCDGKLGKLLREKYESVMLSQTLGGNGIELICSGQLNREDIFDLIRHSWEFSKET